MTNYNDNPYHVLQPKISGSHLITQTDFLRASSFRGRNRFHLVFVCTCLQSLGLRHSYTAVTRQDYTNINYLKLIKSYPHLPQPGLGSSLCFCAKVDCFYDRRKHDCALIDGFLSRRLTTQVWVASKFPPPFPLTGSENLPMPFI